MLMRALLAFLLCSTLHAQVSQKWLDKRAAHWAEVLHLQGWEIYVIAVPEETLPKGDVAACSWDDARKRMKIYVLRPHDYAAALQKYPALRHGFKRDTDESILHELVHLEFKDLGSKDLEAEEAAVVRVTAALIRKRNL